MIKRAMVDIATKDVDDEQCSVECNFCLGRIRGTNNVVCHIFWVYDEDNEGFEDGEIEYKQCEHMDEYGECSDPDCKQLNDGDVINRHPHCISRESTLE